MSHEHSGTWEAGLLPWPFPLPFPFPFVRGRPMTRDVRSLKDLGDRTRNGRGASSPPRREQSSRMTSQQSGTQKDESLMGVVHGQA